MDEKWIPYIHITFKHIHMHLAQSYLWIILQTKEYIFNIKLYVKSCIYIYMYICIYICMSRLIFFNLFVICIRMHVSTLNISLVFWYENTIFWQYLQTSLAIPVRDSIVSFIVGYYGARGGLPHGKPNKRHRARRMNLLWHKCSVQYGMVTDIYCFSYTAAVHCDFMLKGYFSYTVCV